MMYHRSGTEKKPAFQKKQTPKTMGMACPSLRTGHFLRKIPIQFQTKQVSWLADRCAPRLLTTHWLRSNGNCGLLPAYSDRIARDLHPIPFYPSVSWALGRCIQLHLPNHCNGS